MADAPEWAASEPAPAWANSPAEPPAPAWSAAAPAPAQPEPEKPSTLTSIGRNAAAVGDIALGTPAWLAKIGQTGVTDVIAAVKGDPHPLQSATEATEADWADEHFLQAPLQTTFGIDQQNTAVGQFMGKIGGAVDKVADAATQSSGNPEHGALVRQAANIVMAKAGDLLIGGGKAAGKVTELARKRMAEATPTGATPAPEWVTTAGKSASTPVDRPEIVGAKARKSSLAEGEYISSPDEGDLGPLPPIEAYEPSAEAHQHIHEALSDPDLHTGHPEAMEVARDVAAEKVKGAVQADRVRQAKPQKHDSITERIRKLGGVSHTAIEDISGEVRTGKGIAGIRPGLFTKSGRGLDDMARSLKDAGYDIDTESVDGGVQQLKDMIRDEIGGAKHLPAEGQYAEFERMMRDRYQEGGVNRALAGYLGITAGGAAIGAALNDDPLTGAFEGAGAGFAMARVGHVLHDYGAGASLKATIDVLKPSVDPMRKAAADVHNAKTANVKAAGRYVGAIQRVWKQSGISDDRAAHLTHLYESGDLSSATPKEAALLKKIGDAYAKLGTRAQQAGVVPHLIMKNFVPHVWDMKDAATKEFFDKMLESGAGDAASAGAFTAHSLRRSIPTYAEGVRLGLKPKTLNPAEILGFYANSVIKATENANALYTLKSMKLPDGHYAVEPVGGNMPKSYITDHKISGLEGFGVHPEMVDAVRRGFDDYRPGAIQKAMLAVAFTSKRLAVSYSLFHPMSLLVAYTGAGGNPFGFAAGAAARGVEKLSGNRIKIPFKSAVDAARDQYLKAGAGDIPDFAIRNGLEIGTTLEDTVGRDSFLKMTGAIDKAIGGDVTGIKPFTMVDNAVHEFTWGYLHTGMKLETFGREFERMLSDPKNADKDVNQIAADAASYTNNIFGGLNWDRVIEGMRSKFGRGMAGSAFSKHGRAILQTAAFAPDWLMSTMRSWIQAVPGLGENAAVAKMHRAYLARSLMYTMAITDALNLYYSGHHVWENDFRSQRQKDADPDDEGRTAMDTIHDMTYIDMGDGTKIEGNKHLFEFVNAATAPAKFGMGKMGSIVTDPLNAAMNKQWLSPTWAPKITEGGTTGEKAGDYAKWWGKQHMPMSVQQLGSGSVGGTFGFPRTGISTDKREELRQQQRDLKEERGLK